MNRGGQRYRLDEHRLPRQIKDSKKKTQGTTLRSETHTRTYEVPHENHMYKSNVAELNLKRQPIAGAIRATEVDSAAAKSSGKL